jgi:hypothetical protein
VFAAIRAGKPVVIGASLTDSWQSTSDGKVRNNGYIIGGHAILVVGYRDDASAPGGGWIDIKNSWGTKWGDLGYAHMPYSYCEVQDCTFMEVSAVQYKGVTYDVSAPPPSPPPDPSTPDAGPPTPPPAPSGEATAYDIDVEAIHDPANPARFKLHLVERKAGALAQVAQVTYDVHETFGSYQYATVKTSTDGFVIPFYYRTYAHHWRTNGATVKLSSGTNLYLAGAVIDW